MVNDHRLIYEWDESEIDIKRRVQQKKEAESKLSSSQRDIIDYHKHANHPFLVKTEQNIGPNCVTEGTKIKFYMCKEMAGNNNDKVSFLPDMCYKVGTYYAFSIDQAKLIDDGIIGSDMLSQRIRTCEGNTTIKMPFMNTIFDIRNSYKSGKKYCFATTPEVKPESLDQVVENLEAGFRISVTSSSQGMLVCYMNVDHYKAEAIIQSFFRAVGQEFAEYQNLQSYGEGETKRGLRLWDKKVLKGWKYWGNKKLLHFNLFSNVEKMLRQEGLNVETTYKVSDMAKGVMKTSGIDVDKLKEQISKEVKEEIEKRLGIK